MAYFDPLLGKIRTRDAGGGGGEGGGSSADVTAAIRTHDAANDAHGTLFANKADAEHAHEQSDIAGLSDALSGKASSSHSHAQSDITGLSDALSGKAASSHGHAQSDITGLSDALSGKAASTHSHAQSDITGLSDALSGKAASSHSHAQSDITGLSDALSGKAASSHSHAQSDITGLSDALSGKASSSHTHVMADITDLDVSDHTHEIADVIGLASAMAGKVDLPYLCFTAIAAGSTIKLSKANSKTISLEYSSDKVTWVDYTFDGNEGAVLTLASVGDKVYFRGDNGAFSTSSQTSKFVMTGSIEASGNIMSLLDRTCQSLEVPDYGFRGLFYDCTSLTRAPEMPATTLKNYCYEQIYRGDTNLEDVPDLPRPISIGTKAFQYMFYGCSKLKRLCVGFAEFAGYGTSSAVCSMWLNGVSSTGTFVCPSSLVIPSASTSTVPSGWTIVRFCDEVDSSISSSSGNPVANSAVFSALEERESARTSVTDISSTSITLASAAANTDYHYGTLTALTVSAVAASDLETTIEFTSGSTACAMTLPSGVNAELVETPLANRRYMLSIRNGVAIGMNFLTSGTITFSGQTVSVTSGASITAAQLTATASNGGTVTYMAVNIPSGITISSGGYISGTYNESTDVTMAVTASAPMCQPVTVNVVFEITAPADLSTADSLTISGCSNNDINGTWPKTDTMSGCSVFSKTVGYETLYLHPCYLENPMGTSGDGWIIEESKSYTTLNLDDEGGGTGIVFKKLGALESGTWTPGIYGDQALNLGWQDQTLTLS